MLPIAFEQDLRSQYCTLLINGKPNKQWTSVKEPGDFEAPYVTTHNGIKVELSWDEDEDKPILKLDG